MLSKRTFLVGGILVAGTGAIAAIAYGPKHHTPAKLPVPAKPVTYAKPALPGPAKPPALGIDPAPVWPTPAEPVPMPSKPANLPRKARRARRAARAAVVRPAGPRFMTFREWLVFLHIL